MKNMYGVVDKPFLLHARAAIRVVTELHRRDPREGLVHGGRRDLVGVRRRARFHPERLWYPNALVVAKTGGHRSYGLGMIEKQRAARECPRSKRRTQASVYCYAADAAHGWVRAIRHASAG